MKSVMNSKRSPFQVKRYGTRRRLAIELGRVPAQRRPHRGERVGGRRGLGLDNARRPQDAHDVGAGASAEAEHDVAGRAAGVAADVSSFCRRLPARISTFDADAVAVADLAGRADPQRRLRGCRHRSSHDQVPRPAPSRRAAPDRCRRRRRRRPTRSRSRRRSRERQHRPHRDACGRRSSVLPALRSLHQPGRGGGHDVEPPVVVEIDELRRGRAVEAVGRRRREPAAAVAGGKDAGAAGAAEEEVGEAVLVHVGGGDRVMRAAPRRAPPGRRRRRRR